MGFGKAFGAALLGMALGGLVVFAVTAAMGVAAMFVAWPIYTVILLVLGLVAALLVAVIARMLRVRSTRPVMLAAGALACGPFLAIVLAVIAGNAGSGRW